MGSGNFPLEKTHPLREKLLPVLLVLDECVPKAWDVATDNENAENGAYDGVYATYLEIARNFIAYALRDEKGRTP